MTPLPMSFSLQICSLGADKMPHGRKHGAQCWPSMGSLFTNVMLDEGASVAPGLEAGAGGGGSPTHPGRPTTPTKAQEGPLVETPTNSPVSGVLPPQRLVAPRDPPHLPGVLRPKDAQ